MMMSVHVSRACACGVGLSLPLSDASGGGDSPPLVAERKPLVACEIRTEADIDAYVWPRKIRLGKVRCPNCGSRERTTHTIICVDGVPAGAETLAGMMEHARREDQRGRAKPANPTAPRPPGPGEGD